MVEMPDDLDIRRHREADQGEVRRLHAEIAAQAAASAAELPGDNDERTARGGPRRGLSSSQAAPGAEVVASARNLRPATQPKTRGSNAGLETR